MRTSRKGNFEAVGLAVIAALVIGVIIRVWVGLFVAPDRATAQAIELETNSNIPAPLQANAGKANEK